MNKIEQAMELLNKYGQSHIKVNNEEIAEQILNIDFEKLNELQEHIYAKEEISDIENIEPVTAINPEKIEELRNLINYLN